MPDTVASRHGAPSCVESENVIRRVESVVVIHVPARAGNGIEHSSVGFNEALQLDLVVK